MYEIVKLQESSWKYNCKQTKLGKDCWVFNSKVLVYNNNVAQKIVVEIRIKTNGSVFSKINYVGYRHSSQNALNSGFAVDICTSDIENESLSNQLFSNFRQFFVKFIQYSYFLISCITTGSSITKAHIEYTTQIAYFNYDLLTSFGLKRYNGKLHLYISVIAWLILLQHNKQIIWME